MRVCRAIQQSASGSATIAAEIPLNQRHPDGHFLDTLLSRENTKGDYVAWKITKDHLNADEPNAEFDRTGYSEEHTRIAYEAAFLGFQSEPLPTGEKIHFQLFDDDGELYYEGELDDDDECLNQLHCLKWAEGDAGCTTIKVLRDGEWKAEIG